MAACTSWAAASIFRLRVNWSVIWVVPSALVEVMLSMPAMVENCFSSGVATAEAMVSGLAPGSDRRDLNGGEIHVGQVAHRQEPVAHDPEEENAQHDEGGHDGPADEQLGDAHGVGPPAAATAALG